MNENNGKIKKPTKIENFFYFIGIVVIIGLIVIYWPMVAFFLLITVGLCGGGD